MGILIAGPKVIQTTPLTNPTVSKKGHFPRGNIRSDYVGSNPFQSFNILYGIERKVWGFDFSDLAAVWPWFCQFCSKFWHFGRISREKNVRLGIEFETSWHEKELNSVT